VNGARIAKAIKSDELLAHAASFQETKGRCPFVSVFRVDPPREPRHWLIVEHVGGVQVGCQVHSWLYIACYWERLAKLFHLTEGEQRRLSFTLSLARLAAADRGRESLFAHSVARIAELESLLRGLLEAMVSSSADGDLIVLGDAINEYNAAARALGLPEGRNRS